MDAVACAVGRLGPGGPWVGFAPTLDDGYAWSSGVCRTGRVGPPPTRTTCWPWRSPTSRSRSTRRPMTWRRPTATSAPWCATSPSTRLDPSRRRLLDEAVDAVDDGLAAEVTIARLTRALGDGADAASRLRRRVEVLLKPA